MAENDFGESAKAKLFFDKGRKAAESGDFDTAISLYVEGLRHDPRAVEEGHIRLRELALRRHEKGGQKPSPQEVTERLQGRSPLERMLNAEYLLAKDPTHLPYAEKILRAAIAGDYKETAKWIADLVFLANNNAKKPSLNLYLLLKDSYSAIGRYDRALAACECAIKLRPNDQQLADERRRLSDQWITTEKDANQLADVGRGGGIGEMQQAYQTEDGIAMAKAKSLFDKAKQVAEIEDFDYAIDLYIQGLRHYPEALLDGHLALHELALQRQSKKGKKPSMIERVKQLTGRDPLERMLNAEQLFAKDPSHLPYGESMLKAAVAGGYPQTAKWVADLIFQANNAAKKPSFGTYIVLKNCYRELGQFDRALAACQCAARIKPQDDALADEVKNLTAEMTVARGRYDQEGDFRKSIKDRETQERLHSQESIVKTVDYRTLAVQEARKSLARDPNLAKNIFALAQALSELENDKADKEAVQLLENAYKTKSDFSFRQRAGEITIKQLRRKVQETKEAFEAKGENVKLKAKIATLSAQLNNMELLHYRACVENYPTDLHAKYEYGIRLMGNKQFDEAIPLFQEAQRDPRHKIAAMDKIGLCFFRKGWYSDAVDVFSQAIESYRIKDDQTAKELRYNLARAHEEQGEKEKALEIYRKIAQLDFAFKDVRQRVDRLRSLGA